VDRVSLMVASYVKANNHHIAMWIGLDWIGLDWIGLIDWID
jgi:hypothetical protein